MIFVDYKMDPTSGITTTPIKVFSKNYNCIIDGISIVNMVNNTINVGLYMTRQPSLAAPIDMYDLRKNITLNSYQSLDILHGESFNLEYTDALFAYSDFSENIFNVFISYRALTETGVQTI